MISWSSPCRWRLACSLCFLLSRVPFCSGSLAVPRTMEEGPVTARAQLNKLPLERRDSISTCQGNTGYITCPVSLGGGCCPQDLVCATDNECTRNVAATTTSTELACDANFYQCPKSLGGKETSRDPISAEAPSVPLTMAYIGGCCSDGEPCGSDVCNHYYMSTSTTVLLATDSLASASISTTVLTLARTIGQFSPSITRTSVLEGSTTVTASRYTSTVLVASAGLSPATIGGISGGVVVFVLILAGTGFILFRYVSRISRSLDGLLGHNRKQEDGDGGSNKENEASGTTGRGDQGAGPEHLGELSPPGQATPAGRLGQTRYPPAGARGQPRSTWAVRVEW